jgi:carboxypeptidase C (cathepsin A)
MVDDAGHMAPRDQPHGVTQLVKAWLTGSLDTMMKAGDGKS